MPQDSDKASSESGQNNSQSANPYQSPFSGNTYWTPPAETGYSFQNPYQGTQPESPTFEKPYQGTTGSNGTFQNPYQGNLTGNGTFQNTYQNYQGPVYGPNAYSQPATGVYQNYGQTRSQQRRVLMRADTNNKPTWTYIILGIIVAVFIGQSISGGNPLTGGLDPFLQQGALVKSQVLAGQWWRLITPIFLHFGLMHILFNGIALFALGIQLEQLMGSKRFLWIFFLTGIGGDILVLLLENRPAITAGASGAIFGLLGALIGFFYRHRDRTGAWGRANLQSLLITAGINLLFTISIPGISIYGHLGGFATGLFLGYFLSPLDIKKTIGDGAQTAVVKTRDFLSNWWSVPALILIELIAVYLAFQTGQQTVPASPFGI